MAVHQPEQRGPSPQEPPDPAGQQPFDASLHESWLPREHPLYRPRHTSQRLARICAAIFFVVPIVSLAIFGPPPAIENHAVAGFPGITRGWGFFTGLAPWAVDNLPFRKGAIEAADGISRGLFGEPAPLGQGSTDTGPLPAQQTTTPTTTPSTPSAPVDQTSDGFPEVVEGTGGWLYFGYDMQARCEPSQPLATVVANLDRLRDAVQQSGRQFVLFVAPDKSSVEPAHLPASYAGKDCSLAGDAQFWGQMDTNVGAVDPRPEIQAADQSGRSVYFPQDTHWNYTGGLIMTRELAEKIQPGVTASWRLTQGRTVSGPSDLPPMIAQTGTNTSYLYHLAPDGVTNLDRPLKSDLQGPVTVHDDEPVLGMVTDRTTMIDDSFTQYASPLLAATFADLTMVSPQTVASDPAGEANRMVDSQVVVVEVVERDLVGGVSPVTSDSFVNTVTTTLAAHPAH